MGTQTRVKIQRIRIRSVLRLGLALGWLVSLVPALMTAALTVALLERLHRFFQQFQPVQISFLGREIARVDFLEALRLQAAAQTTSSLVENPALTFLWAALLLTLAGGLLIVIATLIGVMGYNLLARAGLGLEVEFGEK